jgi:hypothetical protein
MQFNKRKVFLVTKIGYMDICSLRHVLSLFQEGESSEKDNKKTKKESKRVCQLFFSQSIMIH